MSATATALAHCEKPERYIDALDISSHEKHMIFEGNARRVYPRLDAILKERGL
jgi:4-oxalmesaconate hydratase